MNRIIICCMAVCMSISLWAQTASEFGQIRSQANMGNAEAQFQLGYCYANGLGDLSQSYSEAVKWIRKSADKGYAIAECAMGSYYEIGVEGVITPNPNEAVKWYKKSAEQGYAEAQCYLGNAYMNGFGGLKQSNEEALKWYKKSAEQGFYQGEVTMGFYHKNAGNRDTAIYWLEKALATARANRSEVEKDMLAEFDNNYISPLEQEIKELRIAPVTKSATYLTVSTSSLSFSAYSSTSTISVSTDGSLYEVSYLPSWCSVTNNTGSSFQIVCQANTGATRTDWFKVKSDDKEVRINVSQAAGVKVPSAEFEKVWVVHNVFENPYNIYSHKGMQIHIKFSVDGMLNKKGDCVVWFHFSNGTSLEDYNNSYRTTDGKVATSRKFTPSYESCIFNDFVIFMPYDELHLSRGSHNLKFYIGLFDYDNKQMVTSDDVCFSFNNL